MSSRPARDDALANSGPRLPAAPVVDYLRSRPDVDPGRIALNGSSLGGQLVIPASGQGPEVCQRLRSDKTCHEFTAAQGAQDHCAPMAPQTQPSRLRLAGQVPLTDL